jgi:hypothetical protein
LRRGNPEATKKELDCRVASLLAMTGLMAHRGQNAIAGLDRWSRMAARPSRAVQSS